MTSSRSVACLLLVLVFSLTAGCAQLVGPPQMSKQGEQALQHLETAQAFAGASVGFAGTTSETVKAFRILLGEPKADQAFKSLLGHATKPGQLYALAGLYFTDRGHMKDAADRYLEDDSKVKTFFGCTIDKEPVSRLAGAIVEGSLPKQFKGNSDSQ